MAVVGATVLTAAVAGAATSAPTARGSGAGEPKIDQMVVFRSGKVLLDEVVAKRTSVRIGRRTCAVASATALAGLLRSKPGEIAFHDYGSCSRRPADSSGLFVKALRGERNRAQDGWVYKVGRKLATAGAADPTGPFGSGRLGAGDDVVWFYCRQFSSGTCQRSLETAHSVEGRRVTVTVTGYDDSGDGVAVRGAAVHVGRKTHETDGDGRATFDLPRGSHRIYASKKGAIRSFGRSVKVR